MRNKIAQTIAQPQSDNWQYNNHNVLVQENAKRFPAAIIPNKTIIMFKLAPIKVWLKKCYICKLYSNANLTAGEITVSIRRWVTGVLPNSRDRSRVLPTDSRHNRLYCKAATRLDTVFCLQPLSTCVISFSVLAFKELHYCD